MAGFRRGVQSSVAQMSDPIDRNATQGEYWERRSSSWIEAEEYMSLITGSFGRRAMDRLAVGPGTRVLDVGCGTGSTTIELATRVSPGGSAVGIDIAPSMLKVARARAGSEGVDNIEFVVGDAQSGDLGSQAFDAVFSQFGVMFFSDPATAFANLHRALRNGGRIAFACWQDVFVNEWMFVPGSAVVAVTGALPPMPGPGEPGPFSLADPRHVEELLLGAGFGSIEVLPHEEQVVVSAGQLEMVVEAACRVGGVREALDANDDPAFHEQLRSAVRAALLDRVQDGQLRLGAAALLVAAEQDAFHDPPGGLWSTAGEPRTGRFRFAGSHSWAIDTTERRRIESWFDRFAALKPQLAVLDVVVNGPPWNMSACVVFDGAVRDHSGQVVYTNHGVQYMRLRWGRIILDQVNLDTQKMAGYDAMMGWSRRSELPLRRLGATGGSPRVRSPGGIDLGVRSPTRRR